MLNQPAVLSAPIPQPPASIPPPPPPERNINQLPPPPPPQENKPAGKSDCVCLSLSEMINIKRMSFTIFRNYSSFTDSATNIRRSTVLFSNKFCTAISKPISNTKYPASDYVPTAATNGPVSTASTSSTTTATVWQSVSRKKPNK